MTIWRKTAYLPLFISRQIDIYRERQGHILTATRSLQPLQKKLAVTTEEPQTKPHALTPVPVAGLP